MLYDFLFNEGGLLLLAGLFVFILGGVVGTIGK